MTERQYDEGLLNELLQRTGPREPLPSAIDLPALDERQLLQAANQVGTPALVPAEPDLVAPTQHAPASGAAASSFGGEVLRIARRYPLPTLALAAGLALIATRRRRR